MSNGRPAGVFDAAYNAIKKRHNNIPQDPLPLDVTAEKIERSAEPTKRKGPRSVRWAKCPKCLADRATGVVRLADGSEVFRDHNKTLHSGRRVPCVGSGMVAPTEEPA